MADKRESSVMESNMANLAASDDKDEVLLLVTAGMGVRTMFTQPFAGSSQNGRWVGTYTSAVASCRIMGPNPCSSLWLYVKVVVHKPLKHLKKVQKSDGSLRAVQFKYKGFPISVSSTDIHNERFCEQLLTSSGVVERAWGVWLRAPTRQSMEKEED
ncbi:hypothetical protein GH714_013474 [Hevea brasiliensis]|uniref:Uncharacterized protein n=1 Tax=Hevea brasiliensis TaxID=3981 RepID=A0A6A6KP57_HEVBR|nr:hypothetical protein GH714_013474 [Hevea brasiliensis]